MKILIYGCECNTATDGIIYRGCETVLSRLYPEVEFSYLNQGSRFYRDATNLPDEALLSSEKFDAIVVPGSPFIWDQYYSTPKITNLLRAKEIHECPVIWMGIGSCFPLDNIDIAFRKDHLENTKRIFKDDLVIVRDSLAQKIMEKSGVKSTHLVCPSYYSQKIVQSESETLEFRAERRGVGCYDLTRLPPRKEKLIVFYEPTIGLSFQSWEDPKKLEEYYNIFREFYDENTDVVVKDPEEVPFAEKIGLKNVRVLKDVDDTLDTVCKYKKVLSGRIHVGIPALISGCEARLIPIDTRYLTAVNGVDKMEKLVYNLEKDFGVYESQIRRILG